MPDQSNFEILNKEIQEVLKQLGRGIGQQLPKNWGFTLMLFSYKGPELFYISNANREDMIKTMHEFIDKLKEDSSSKG